MARPLKIGTLCAAGGLLWCSVASANPIMSEISVIRQQPGTHHVQVTFGTYQGVDNLTFGELTRDGQVVPANWSSPMGYSKNTGSGVRSTSSRQICDCDVAVGTHTYEFLVDGTQKSNQCTVVESLGEPDPPRDAGPEAMPWDIPDPVGWQGLNCKTYCEQRDAGLDAADATDDQSVAPPDASDASTDSSLGAGGGSGTEGGPGNAGGSSDSDGSLGTGGKAATGGSVGKGGNSAPGSSVGKGGNSATDSSAAGAAGTSDTAPSSDGCSVQAGTSSRGHFFAGALVAVGLLLNRRRRAPR